MPDKTSAIYAEAFRLESEVKQLRSELATALRERDEAREQARAAQAAWAKAKFRALPEGAQDALDDVIARADVAESRIDVSERRRDTAESALAAARRECEGLRADIAALLPMAERAHHRDLGKHLGSDISDLPEGLRIAGEGALLLRLHHPDIAALAAPADGDSK